MIYINMMISFLILLIGFNGVQKNIKTLTCVNEVSFKRHSKKLKNLVEQKHSFQLPSLCQSRVNFEVEITGMVTNE